MTPVRYNTVIFDCDSTLSSIEGVEELAVDHRTEVSALTEAAMRGEVPLDAVYARRLELVRPNRARVAAVGRRYVETLVPDAREVIAALRSEGIDVRVVSGGLRPAVLALARALGIPDAAVAAVDVHFGPAGEYAGFDEASPLARSNGKRDLIDAWAPELSRPVMLVGDGVTDLEARPAVDLFVAFMGVAERPAVAAAADVVIRAPTLAPVLPLALGGRPPPAAEWRACYEKGLHALNDPASRR